MNIYIFSKLFLNAKHQNQTYSINKNCTLKIENVKESENIEIYCPQYKNQSIFINPFTAKSCNFFNVWNLNSDIFIEIISTSFNNLIQKIHTQNCEVFLYQNSLRLIYENICYTYNYENLTTSFAIEKDNKIYIYNSANVVVFDLKNKTFKKLIVEKVSKNNEQIEILCKILPFLNYFLLFFINLNNSSVQIKKLKKDIQPINPSLLPNIIFSLCSFEISDLSEYLSSNINCKNLFEYFAKFQNLITIENNNYLYNFEEFVPINFIIKNNIIVDID